MINPLFPTNDNDLSADALPDEQAVGNPPRQKVQPSVTLSPDANAAVNLIRQKLNAIYAKEPDAAEELVEAETATRPRSKHQLFIESLQNSGKNLAEIQTAWHNYYVGLPDEEKFEVWQEFYTSNNIAFRGQLTPTTQPLTSNTPQPKPPLVPLNQVVVDRHITLSRKDNRSLADTRKALLSTIQNQILLKPRDQLKSLAFGIVCGVIVIAIFLFSFFNEVIIAPFIQPSRHVSSIPLIITASTISTSSPQVIIPKINVEIPVDYSETSTNENVIENDLEGGVVHYPNTVLPGQNGNSAFFGHSSNNIFNPGKYKFAFVLLHTLVNGDTFYLTYNNKIFVYDVIDHKVVPPTDVGVLNDTEGHQATATLITCDPPGTSINRLIVTGVQISPDPTSNTAAPISPQIAAQPASLPGNGPSLWSRFVHWLF
jgi:sortase A